MARKNQKWLERLLELVTNTNFKGGSWRNYYHHNVDVTIGRWDIITILIDNSKRIELDTTFLTASFYNSQEYINTTLNTLNTIYGETWGRKNFTYKR